MILFCLKNKISLKLDEYTNDIITLTRKGFIAVDHDGATIMEKGDEIINTLESYVSKVKKKTHVDVMGKDFAQKIEEYRALFPAMKLPSGKPARQNVKALAESFKWFFETYDFTWDQVIDATRMYVREYADKDYLYMMTSQYFISKQDKNKVKHSALADYCDMIADGVKEEVKTFNEKVV